MVFECSFCSGKFYRKQYLQAHVSRMHGANKDKKRRDVVCLYCEKKFTTRKCLSHHVIKYHKVVCQEEKCNEKFRNVYDLRDHLYSCHGKKDIEDCKKLAFYKYEVNRDVVISNRDNGKIKCMECNVKYGNVRNLRDHLSKYHNLNIVEKEIRFPNMIAFKKWKLDIERRERTFFYAAHGYKKQSKFKKRLYRCHRTGNYTASVHENKNKMSNVLGSLKIGTTCTAMMTVTEHPEEVQVKYCLQHYGHGQDITFVQLSAEEQAAVNENVSKGIPLQEQLDDIKHAQSLADHFQARMLKIRDVHFLNNVFASEIYNAGMSAIEYVEQWVRLCSEMEDSPILLYRQEGVGTKTEDTMLIIMTEFQKHILMTSTKEVVCLDSHRRVKKGNNFLTALIVMDDQDVAFPVAFCISNDVSKSTMLEFLSSVKESTGPLSCSYFMSNNDKIYHETWQEVMQDNSIWIWSIWSFVDKIRKQLVRLIKHIPTREATYRQLRTIMECNNQQVFTTMLKNFQNSLANNTLSNDFGAFFESQYGSNQEMWAYCYRKNLKFSSNFYLEYMHKSLQHCFNKNRNKQLDKFLMVLMKYLRFKMIDRLSNMLDEEKIDLAKKAITMCHDMGLEIECESINSLSDKIWLIRSENEVDTYVTQEYTSCPELCDLRCPDCDVCVHMFSCTCVHSMINANMCRHIHAVVWKFLTPHFSPPASPGPDPCDDAGDVPDDELVTLDMSPDLLKSILKRMQGVYKQVRMNKCRLNKSSLSEVLRLLDRCYQICSSCDATCDLFSKSTQTEAVPLISSVHRSNGLVNDVFSSNSENFTPMPMATSNPGWQVIANTALNPYRIQNKSDFLPMTTSIPGFVAVQKIALSSEGNSNPASIIVVPSDPGQNSVGNSAWNTSTFMPVVSSNPVLNTLDDSISISENQKQVAAVIPSSLSNPILNVLDNTLYSSDKCKAVVKPSRPAPSANSLSTSKRLQKRTSMHASLGSVSNPVSKIKRVKKGSLKRIHFPNVSPSLVTNSPWIIKTTAPSSSDLPAVSLNTVPNSVANKRPVAKKRHIERTSVTDVPVMKDSSNDSDNPVTNSPLLIETTDSSSDNLPDASVNTISYSVHLVPSVVKPTAVSVPTSINHSDAKTNSTGQITCVTLPDVSVNTASKFASQTPSDASAHSASRVIYVSVKRASNADSPMSFKVKPALPISASSNCSDVATNSSDEKSSEKSSDGKTSSSHILLNSSALGNQTKSEVPCVIESYQSLKVLSDKSKELDTRLSPPSINEHQSQFLQDSVSKKCDVVKTTVSSSDVLSSQSNDTISILKPTPIPGSSPCTSKSEHSVVELSVLSSSSNLSPTLKKKSVPHIPVLVKASKSSISSPSASSNASIVINYTDSTKLLRLIESNIKTTTNDRDENSEIPETTFGIRRSGCSVCDVPGGALFRIPSHKDRYEKWFSMLKWNVPPEKVERVLRRERVCERHFPESSFTNTFRNRLSKFACPLPHII